jgi:hypothetical protein
MRAFEAWSQRQRAPLGFAADRPQVVWFSRINDARCHARSYELRHIVHTGCLINSAAAGFDGANTDTKSGSNLLVGYSIQDQHQNLSISIGQ